MVRGVRWGEPALAAAVRRSDTGAGARPRRRGAASCAGPRVGRGGRDGGTRGRRPRCARGVGAGGGPGPGRRAVLPGHFPPAARDRAAGGAGAGAVAGPGPVPRATGAPANVGTSGRLRPRAAGRTDGGRSGPLLTGVVAPGRGDRGGAESPGAGRPRLPGGLALEPAIDRGAPGTGTTVRRPGRRPEDRGAVPAGTSRHACGGLPAARALSRQRGGRRHSAIARSASTATTPVPTAPMTAPTMAPIAVELPQSPWQPISVTP